MAVVIILAGSLLGFSGGAVAYLLLDVSLFTSIAIWVAAGPVSAVVAVVLSNLTQPARAQGNSLPDGKVA